MCTRFGHGGLNQPVSKVMTEYHAGLPRGQGSQKHGFGGVFQVVERLSLRLLIPVAALGHKGLD